MRCVCGNVIQPPGFDVLSAATVNTEAAGFCDALLSFCQSTLDVHRRKASLRYVCAGRGGSYFDRCCVSEDLDGSFDNMYTLHTSGNPRRHSLCVCVRVRARFFAPTDDGHIGKMSECLIFLYVSP
jgi:hypothetical protein